MSSYLKILDLGVRSLLYTKFSDILTLESIAKGVLLYPKGVAQREIAERRGNTELEFISVWRTVTGVDWERARSPLARRGIDMPYTLNGTTTSVNVKTMPVKLNYRFWVWSKDKDKLNDVSERYLFWQHTNPNLDLLYMDLYPLDFDLSFGDITDESVVESKYDTGMYFVYSMDLKVDGWVFQAADPSDDIIRTIHISCYDKDDLSLAISPTYEEVYVEDSNQNTELEASLKLFQRTITE